MTKWRQCVATSDNFRACLQSPEWVEYRWRPFSKTFVAMLRGTSDDVLAVTPLVETKCPLTFSISGRQFATIDLNGLLLNGNVPLFPQSYQCYEALCTAALTVPSVDCLYMSGVPTTTAFWGFLGQAQEAHPEWLIYAPHLSPHRYLYIDTAMSYREYLGKFRAKTLKERKRKLRVLEREAGGTIELMRVRGTDDVPEFLVAAHAIAKRSWKRQLVDFQIDQSAERHGLLSAMARQGALRAYVLKCNDVIYSFLIGFQLNKVLYLHETAFDSAYAHLSPGQSLLYLAIRDCFEVDKPSAIYFGPGESFHKRLFANRFAEEMTIMILKNTPTMQMKIAAHGLFENRLKVFARSILGAASAKVAAAHSA